ncbi:ISL3 family transposase [Paenibacillus sp. Soil724D2]|uniref:ISL3 family transposase n=1 Tax=Paenibacillus sp. (strain Soil724D2) TaxID=1736392 RepID=UPI0007154E23|nr:ISL3 family transposase [Paenibacillus sp. Soil724D2]KRE36275.1 transposase [Paenibacillus sp. Soil724D2]
MDILNLPKFHILSIRENEFDFLIQVVTNSPPLTCAHCGCLTNLYKHDNREQICMDLPINGKRVGLLIKRQRYRCRDCNRTFWERLDHTIDEKRRCTKRLLFYVVKQSLKRTFVSISDDVGLNEKTVRNIFRDYINRVKETLRFETPNWLGIDEIHLIKPRCVLTNMEEHTLLDVLPNRNKETVVDCLSRLTNRERIQYVTMDMWKPYKDAVRAVLPKAIIIVDKFPVLCMANQALETIRKQLKKGLSPKARRGLMNDRYILLKRHRELTEIDRILLDQWTNHYPSLGIAYNLKESFFDIWDSDSRHKAYLKYHDWKAKLPNELHAAFEPLTKSMENWEEEIFAYFDHRVTNVYTESLNSLIRITNRLGRGYSFEALRAKILFTEELAKQRKPMYQWRTDTYVPEETTLLGIDIFTLIEKLEKGKL